MFELHRGPASARIDPLGAELRSLRFGGDELLWQDPGGAVWPHSAPLLFPFVGRLRGGGFEHGGAWHAMKIHGFADVSEFEPVTRSDEALTLELRASGATRPAYPFEFRLRVNFALDEAGMTVGYEVLNEDAALPLHFALGSHPAFALDGALDDWRIEFGADEAPQTWRLDGELLATQPEPLAFAPERSIELGPRLFERDALIFKALRSQDLTLVHRERGPRLRLHTGGAPQLGLWAKPGAAYVCIEPWFGVDDDAEAPLALADKPQLLTLAPGGRFETAWRVRRLGR